MTEERWQDVKAKLEETFTIDDQGQSNEDIEHIEWVAFSTKDGKKMLMEWHDKPKKIGERGMASKRIGADVTIEAKYSDTERTQFIVLKTWDPAQESWVELDDPGSFL